MARIKTNGARYFPLDVDYFSDMKIRRLKRDCGDVGVMMHLSLMCSAYSDKSGFYVRVDENLIFDLSERFDITEKQVLKIFDGMFEIGLMDKELYENFSILTSRSIQRQFQEMIKKKGKRSPIKVDEKYWLLGAGETQPFIIVLNFEENYVAENGNYGHQKDDYAVQKDTKTLQNDTKTLQNDTNKRKENKSKEKEIKLNETKAEEAVKEESCGSQTTAAAAEKLIAEYEQYIGKATESVRQGINGYLELGMETQLISRLIQYALEMGKCNWQYIKAAAEGNLAEGIKTLDKYNISCEARQKKRKNKGSPLNNYTDTNKPDYSDFGNKVIEQMLREAEEISRKSENEKMFVLR